MQGWKNANANAKQFYLKDGLIIFLTKHIILRLAMIIMTSSPNTSQKNFFELKCTAL